GARTDIASGVCPRRSVACHHATNRGYGHERQWSAQYGAGGACASYHSPERITQRNLRSRRRTRPCCSTSPPTMSRSRSVASTSWLSVVGCHQNSMQGGVTWGSTLNRGGCGMQSITTAAPYLSRGWPPMCITSVSLDAHLLALDASSEMA